MAPADSGWPESIGLASRHRNRVTLVQEHYRRRSGCFRPSSSAFTFHHATAPTYRRLMQHLRPRSDTVKVFPKSGIHLKDSPT